MYINQKAVKQLVKSRGKQVSSDYIEQLNRIVENKVQISIDNAKHFKRLRSADLLIMK